jgi:hypothetical protein
MKNNENGHRRVVVGWFEVGEEDCAIYSDFSKENTCS